ncbi:MAG: proton-conducting transporter membrane subunit [Patescibacteria group bacterium]|nr:proton-conducting transporter membrane subunit [Patescibacteria group bacterium]
MGIEHYLPELDPLSRAFLAAFLLAGVAAMMYLRSLHRNVMVTVMAIGFIASAVGVVVARDFLSFLVAWELSVLLACCLIVHDRRPASFAVAYRYFLIQIAGGVSLFLAICFHYVATGSLELASPSPRAVPFFLMAFIIKAAVVPLHVWVPMTYPNVPPAIAVILSVYSTKIGVYAFARLLPGTHAIAYAGAFMALFGVVMALRQTTARRLLSYHLVSQVGYMLVGIGLGTELGIAAGVSHMMNHVQYKALLFMATGAVVHRLGTDALNKVAGAGRAMPVTFFGAMVGAAAIAGVPPLNGYVSKTLLKAATEGHTVLQMALLLAGVGTALSFTKFIWRLFLQETPSRQPTTPPPAEMPMGACLGMILLALACIAQGVLYPRFFPMAHDTESVSIHGVGAVLSSAAIVLAGMTLFALFEMAKRLLANRGATRSIRTARNRPTRSAASARKISSRQTTETVPTPWDVDRVYAWLLKRLLQASHATARHARDETQAYLLAIVCLAVALIGFLAW